MIRLAGCRFDPAYTVLAHENGAGIGAKHSDPRSSFACDKCHAEYDSRTEENAEEIELAFMRGHMRTLQWWIDHGYIVIVKAPQPKIQKILPRRF